jgi:hypothetical protein
MAMSCLDVALGDRRTGSRWIRPLGVSDATLASLKDRQHLVTSREVPQGDLPNNGGSCPVAGRP